jgi:hypothetical protein
MAAIVTQFWPLVSSTISKTIIKQKLLKNVFLMQFG